MTASPRPATIVAVVNEQGGDAVRRRAIELARETDAGLILWDADAGSDPLADPLPNQWSAHGEEEQFGERLTVNDLEAAGRGSLARQVAAAQAAGVEAWGWLPAGRDAEALRDYAARQGARAIVVGADSDVGRELSGDGIRVEVVGPRD